MAISTLGELVFQVGNEIVSGFSMRKAVALLVYLAIEMNATHQRESLFTLLRPGMPESSARNNLLQVLFNIRYSHKERLSVCRI